MSCPATGICVAVGDDGTAYNLSDGTWSATTLPVPSNAGASFGFGGLACPATDFCVAAGGNIDTNGNRQGLIETFSSGAWTATEAPLPGNAAATNEYMILDHPNCPAASFCVATGYYTDTSGNRQGLIETFSSGVWTATQAPLPGNAGGTGAFLWDNACPDTSFCVAAGYYIDSSGNQQGLIETLSGGTWTPTEAPLPSNAQSGTSASFSSVACAATSFCVAVGTYNATPSNTADPLIATLSGGTWTATEAPSPSGGGTGGLNRFSTVDCPAVGVCVAVGEEVAYTLSAGTWTATELPFPSDFNTSDPFVSISSVTCPATTLCVAVGHYDGNPLPDGESTNSGVIETFSGGTWTAAEPPLPSNGAYGNTFVSSVACSPAGGFCAVVGVYATSNGGEDGLLETGNPEASPPTVTGLSATSGTVGTKITITGSAFTGTTTVTIGDASCPFTVDSDTQITAWVPADAATGPITVTTPAGMAQGSQPFTVVSQSWVGLGPDSVAWSDSPYYLVSGRIDSLAADPASGSLVYAGSPGGGAWVGRTSGGGAAWAPYQHNVPVGSLASVKDSSGAAVLFAGTGEDGGFNVPPGRGILRSVNGGDWSTVAATSLTGDSVAQVATDPASPANVLAATSKGLLYSADGGTSWNMIQAGHFTAVVQDPAAPSRWWAASATNTSTKCKGTVYELSVTGGTVTTGATYSESFAAGGPFDPFVALAAASNGLLYASFTSCWGNFKQLTRFSPGSFGTPTPIADPSTPGLGNYLSDVGNWGQGNFDNVLAVDPFDPNGCRLVIGGAGLFASINAGPDCPVNGSIIPPAVAQISSVIHVDQHAVLFTGPATFLVGNDGGVWKTDCMGGAWYSIPCPDGTAWSDLNTNLAVAQFYNGDALSQAAVLGGTQDDGTVELANGIWRMDAADDGAYSFYKPGTTSWEYAEREADIIIAPGTIQPPCGQYPAPFLRWYPTCAPGPGAAGNNTPFQVPGPPIFMDPGNDQHLFYATDRVLESKNGGYAGTWADITGHSLTQASGFCASDAVYCPDYLDALAVTSDTNTIFTASAYGSVWRGTFPWNLPLSWAELDARLPHPKRATKYPGVPWLTGIAFNPADAKELWVTIDSRAGGQVWHTTDDTRGSNTTWSNMSGSAFGKQHQPTAIAVTTVTGTGRVNVYVGTSEGEVLECSGCTGTSASARWSNATGLPSVWVNSFSCTRDGSSLVAWTRGRGAWAMKLPSPLSGCVAAEQDSIP